MNANLLTRNLRWRRCWFAAVRSSYYGRLSCHAYRNMLFNIRSRPLLFNMRNPVIEWNAEF